ncbi:MAG TPA: ChaN family lipoprotein [Kofleriaceae bacterium]|nr:ChaN family lipoprotein [Kofleriaceae bacterium]
MARRALWCLALAACGGNYGGPARPTTARPAAAEPPRGIEAAALPYHVLDRTGHQLDDAAFWSKLEGSRVVCVGEEHTNPHDHWVQLQIVQHLAGKWPHLVLGMEMFQRPFQGVLDDFAARRIDDDALRSRSGWADRWGYDYALYAPIFAAAVAAHATLLALNAPVELTKKVSHKGLEGLTAAERQQVPDLELHDAAHRAWFDALMEDMGGASAHAQKNKDGSTKPPSDDMPTADRIYLVQVIWDETMADTTARWLAAHPADHVVILAGNGHCHDSAIINRIKRRGVHDVVSVRAVIDDGQGGVADVLAKPMNDFVVVLELPPDVKAKMAQDQGEGAP